MFRRPPAAVACACSTAASVLAALALSSAPALGADGPVTLLHDGFDQPTPGGVNGLITNQYAYWNADDPTSVLSPVWEMTSGSLFSVGGLGWTGIPDDTPPDAGSTDGNDSQVFRLDTVRSDFGDVSQSVDVRVNGFTSSTDYPAEDYDGVVLWPRYVDETQLYFAYLLRRDGRVEVTKKCTGVVPGGDYYNGGTYFVLADEKPLGGPPEPGHWYHLSSTVQDNADGSVSVLVFRDGDLVDEVVDHGVGCDPIHGPTKLGIRADNVDANLQDYTVTSLAPPGAETGAATSITPTSADIAGTVDPQGGRAWYRLEYGTGVNYADGGAVDPLEVGAQSGPVPVERRLTGLTPGTVYHYRLVAMSSDGERFGPDQTFATPANADSLPVVDSVSIEPSSPQANDVLTADVRAHDPAGLPLALQYQWRKDGLDIPGATGSTLDLADPGAGRKGDRISVRVTPLEDGAPSLAGAAVTSPVVTIHNTPPVVDSVTITPASPATGDTVSADVVKHDADGDPVTFSYQWLLDGQEIPGATGRTLDLSATDSGDRGQSITVRVVATEVLDAGDPGQPASSDPVTSDPVRIVDSAPVVDSVSIDQASVTPDGRLTATVTASDPDHDALTLAYQWRLNGQALAGADASSLQLPYGGAAPGDSVSVTVTARDQDGLVSADVTSAGVPVIAAPGGGGDDQGGDDQGGDRDGHGHRHWHWRRHGAQRHVLVASMSRASKMARHRPAFALR